MYNPLDLGFLGRKLNDLQGLLPDLETLLLVEGSGIQGCLLAVHEWSYNPKGQKQKQTNAAIKTH